MNRGTQPADLVDVDCAAYAEGATCRDDRKSKTECHYDRTKSDQRVAWIQWQAGFARRTGPPASP